MKREFNKFLKTLSEKELIKELQALYSKFEPVRQYYQLELSQDTTVVVREYRQKIKKEYFPNRGYGAARSGVSRKIILDFKKISVHAKDVIELWLYRTEMMLEFSIAYGDMEEAFYNSLTSGFEQACKLIQSECLHQEFKTYCQELIAKSYNLGWGVSFDLDYYFENCFGERP